MFIHRLRHVLRSILTGIGYFVLGIATISLFVGLEAVYLHLSQTTQEGLGFIAFVALVGVFGFYLIAQPVYRFIRWLFIEPFRKKV